MLFTLATGDDIDEIEKIYEYAVKTIRKLGIDQWQNGYPCKEDIIDDLEKKRLYVCRDTSGVIGVCAVIKDGEPTYNDIYGGNWLTNGKYIAIHRFAVSGRSRRCGVGTFMIKRIQAMASDEGFPSIRIDTHEGNIPMRSMLKAAGLTHCGTINLASGDERAAYEKLVKLPRLSKRAKSVLGTVSLLAAFFVVSAILSINLGSACPSYLIFHIRCPFCGMTRAHLAALRLDFSTAFYYHPVFFLGIPYLLLLIFDEMLPQKLKKIRKWAIVVITLIILVVYFIRICRFGIDFFNLV